MKPLYSGVLGEICGGRAETVDLTMQSWPGKLGSPGPGPVPARKRQGFRSLAAGGRKTARLPA